MFNKINRYFPKVYDDIYEFQEIARVESLVVDDIDNNVERTLNSRFITLADADTITRYEQFFGVISYPDETLDFRRQRLLNRFQTKPPFTEKWLQRQLDILIGTGLSSVEVDVQNFILTVAMSINDANLFREVIHMINTVKPANMIYQQRTVINAEIVLEHHLKYAPVTWNYKLDGTWKLGEKPFYSTGTEVVVF